MRQDYRQLARNSLLLAAVPDAVVQRALETARDRTHDRGETIFLQGERATAVYVVADGWVKLYRVAPYRSEAVVGVFTKGASLGEAVAFRHAEYPVATEAVTDCALIRIEADSFLRHIRDNPDVGLPSCRQPMRICTLWWRRLKR